MGFDVSYHPISIEQMNEWYFSKLDQLEQALAFAQGKGLDKDKIEQYLVALHTGFKTEESSLFEKTHGFYLAIAQGFFAPYYYTRGTGFSFLINTHPEMQCYVTSWDDIKPDFIKCKVTGRIVENYSGGVYLSNKQVEQLLEDYVTNEKVKHVLDNFFEQNIPVFIKALTYAKEHQLGVLEATEVIEPNPIDLDETTSYTYIKNCDTEGVAIYRETVLQQLDAIAKSNK